MDTKQLGCLAFANGWTLTVCPAGTETGSSSQSDNSTSCAVSFFTETVVVAGAHPESNNRKAAQ